MALLARLNDFTPSTVIVSQQVDDEFNQLVNILNGTSTNKDALIKFSDAANPVLRVDQISTGAIQQWLQNGVEKVSIRNNGALRINSTQVAADPLKLAISSDANNLGSLVASIQTVGASDKAMRLAMEAASSGGIGALEVTKFDGSVVQAYFQVKTNGEVRIASGHPSTMANVPTGLNVALGGQYQQNVTSVGNVGGGEDDLHSYTIAANTLANDGDSLAFNYGGDFANNANNKTLKAYFGGTAFFDSTAVAFQNAGWRVFGEVTRISSTTVIVTWSFNVNGASGNVAYGRSASIGSLSFTGTLVLKMTATATTDNDATNTVSTVRKFAKGS